MFAKSKNHQKNIFILISLLTIIFFFFISLFIERNIYNNHVNLIFIQGSDFLNGKVLYKEIYVKYGVLGVLINATSLFFFGENIFSIFLIHNFFYFSSIFIILLIINKIDNNSKSSMPGEGAWHIDKLCLILFIVIIHPSIPFAPWPNYLAFFPITLSLLFLLTPKRTNYFYSGFFLSLACLIRETIFLSAIIVCIGIFFFLMLNRKKNINLYKYFIIAFLTPLFFFLLYLLFSDNYHFWFGLIYPTYKLETLANLGYFINEDASSLRKFIILVLGPLREITITLFRSFRNFQPDWILIFTGYLFCFFCVANHLFKKKFDKLTIISIYSLSLILQNLHLVEIIRVSTGSIIGILVAYNYFNKFISSFKLKIMILFIILFSLLLNSKQFFLEIIENIKISYEESYIKKNYNYSFVFKSFKNMNYSPLINRFYLDFEKNCKEIVSKRNIKYSNNKTEYWDFDYYCNTRPSFYFPVSPSLRPKWMKIYNDFSSKYKNYDQSSKNTILFLNSNFKNISGYETLYFYEVSKELSIKEREKIDNRIFHNKSSNFLDLSYKYILIVQKI
jgi:hypothetical protein